MSCDCGSSCQCGSNCKCGKMYPDLSYSETSSTTQTVIVGVAPEKSFLEGSEMGVAGESGGCKCGDDCKCDPCTCK